MSGKFLHLGIIGCGCAGTGHLRSALETGRARIEVWDINDEAKQAVAKKFGVIAAETLESIMTNPEIDAIIIATPNHLHAAMAIKALENGKHVLLEKPMALNAEDARQVAETASRMKRVLHVGFELRNSLFPLEVKKMIANGELGPLVSAQLIEYRGQFWPDWKGRRESGGSMYLMDSCHAIDLFRWWTEDEVESIHAAGSRRNVVHNYEYPDTQFTTFTFYGGFVGHIVSCHTRSAIPEEYQIGDPASVEKMLSPEFGHQYEYSLVGENGSLHFLPLRKVCYIYRHEVRPDGSVWQRPSRTIDYGHFADHGPTIHDAATEVKHFIEMCLGERKPQILPEDALQTHLACFAAQEALDSQQPHAFA